MQLLDDTAQSMMDNSCRNIAFRVLNSLSKQWNTLISIPIITIQGDTEDVDRGGYGTISRGYHEGKLVAIKAITRYSSPDDRMKADRVSSAIASTLNFSHLHDIRFYEEKYCCGTNSLRTAIPTYYHCSGSRIHNFRSSKW